MPFVTDTIYQELYPEEESRKGDPVVSIHTSEWPQSNPRLESESAERIGLLLVDIATRVRRFKSEKNLSLAAPLERLQLVTDNSSLARSLSDAAADLKSVTRTDHIDLVITPTAGLDLYKIDEDVQIAIEL
jgi:valyl-tRNA synthetase